MMIDPENPPTLSQKNESIRPPPLEVSPTWTTAASAEASPRDVKCTIEHQVTTKKDGTKRFLFGMSKPVFAAVATAVLATSGSAAWFFTEWLSLPGLKEQIHALKEQVNRLSYENDRYSELNSQLNETTMEYKLLNVQLSDSATELSHLNDQLNHSNAVFSDLNAHLQSENQIYASLNAELNETKHELSDLNDDLMTIATFLNETSTNLQQSVESLIDYLADQIDLNQLLLLETMRNTYLQRTQNWDCGYRDYFLTEDFIQDSATPIGDMLPEVLDYVDQWLLSDLCLHPENLMLYVESTVNDLDNITSNELIQGVSRYSKMAIDYYFPNVESDEGVTVEEWVVGSHRCSNLQRPFLWS